ncbi:MAG: mRNA interferase RelE/StbE [Bacteroidota bacterium]|nr:mRNA interferase RelE/StbE [Bacteroidota bacterium]
MYKIGISNKVLKQIEKIDDSVYLRISNIIEKLENNPRPNGSIKLTDIEGYRIRAGNFRILYKINEINKEVVVYNIDDRKDIYKRK